MNVPNAEACTMVTGPRSVHVNINVHAACTGLVNSERAFRKLKEEADGLYGDGVKQLDKISELENQKLELEKQLKEFQGLERHVPILHERNKELEEKCEGYEKQLKMLKLEKSVFDSESINEFSYIESPMHLQLVQDFQRLEMQMAILRERNKELEAKCEGYDEQLKKLRLQREDVIDSDINSLTGFSYPDSPILTAGHIIPEFRLGMDDRDNLTNLWVENDKLRDYMGKVMMLVAIWQNRCLSTEKENAKLRNRLRILGNDDTVTQQKPVSRFRRELSVTRECKNCRRNIKEHEIGTSLCMYHSRRPLLFNEWLRLLQTEGTTFTSSDEQKRYWGCCNRLARSAPDGCRVGHHVFENLEQT